MKKSTENTIDSESVETWEGSSNNSNEDSTDDSMSMKETTEEVKDYSRKSSKLFDSIINSQIDINEKKNTYSIIKEELQVKMILLN